MRSRACANLSSARGRIVSRPARSSVVARLGVPTAIRQRWEDREAAADRAVEHERNWCLEASQSQSNGNTVVGYY
jgi:hypothetical protein